VRRRPNSSTPPKTTNAIANTINHTLVEVVSVDGGLSAGAAASAGEVEELSGARASDVLAEAAGVVSAAVTAATVAVAGVAVLLRVTVTSAVLVTVAVVVAGLVVAVAVAVFVAVAVLVAVPGRAVAVAVTVADRGVVVPS
jgi:hypothetical protein